MAAVDKRAVLSALREQLAGEIATMKRLALDAAQAATHEDNRPESDKDMRSTEASYLARGQAERVRGLERDLAQLGGMMLRDFAPGEPVEVGALVELKIEGKVSLHLLLPVGGGVRVRAAGGEVQVTTPKSPLGSALLQVCAGDEVEVSTPQGARTYEIVSVR